MASRQKIKHRSYPHRSKSRKKKSFNEFKAPKRSRKKKISSRDKHEKKIVAIYNNTQKSMTYVRK